MFGWFKKRQSDSYSEQEKKIYKFWNGEREVLADPLVLAKRYFEKRMELHKDILLAKSQHTEADKGYTAANEKIRYIFSIKAPENPLEPLSSKTLLEDELWELLTKFIVYMETLKKNSKSSLITSNSTEDFIPSSKEGPPTNNSAASGSTRYVWSIDEQESLPKASESLSEAANQDTTSGLPLQEMKTTPNS